MIHTAAIDLLRAQGWLVSLEDSEPELAELPRSRYPWLPKSYLEFLSEVGDFISADRRFWLLTMREFRGQSDSAFAWNGFEIQSLDAAEDDVAWRAEVIEFWNNHCPIALSVRGPHRYFAIEQGGAIVCGEEPQYESTAPFAATFEGFLQKLFERASAR